MVEEQAAYRIEKEDTLTNSTITYSSDIRDSQQVLAQVEVAQVGGKLQNAQSSQGLGVSRVIIAEDTRVRVDVTDRFPFSVVGRLQSGCTGVVVGPRHVLTAAHCIYSSDEWLVDLNFIPAQNGEEMPFGEKEWKSCQITREWYEDQSKFEYDYGLIYLKNNIGNQTGVWEVGAYCDGPTLALNLVGYPTDKQPSNTMWLSTCKNVSYSCDEQLFVHECDTFRGMSGAPMFVYRPQEDEQQIFGLRGFHFGSTSNRTQNQALIFTEEFVQRIEGWMKEAEEKQDV